MSTSVAVTIPDPIEDSDIGFRLAQSVVTDLLANTVLPDLISIV